jgi:REP element-mobilizing transposase RayT
MSGVASSKTHGGKREGSGRKRSRYRLDAPHRSRPTFTSPAPVHVTMRAEKWMFGFRSDAVYRVLLVVLARYVTWADFRIVHLSIQDNHLHLIVEADNSAALEGGMRSFTINAARAINAAFGNDGRVFFRYHSTVIRTRRYARNVIAYVLGNWRRHKQDFANGRLLDAMLDRYSSAISFDGWNQRFAIPDGYVPVPVVSPTTQLLSKGWAFDGPLDPWHVPGPLW